MVWGESDQKNNVVESTFEKKEMETERQIQPHQDTSWKDMVLVALGLKKNSATKLRSGLAG